MIVMISLPFFSSSDILPVPAFDASPKELAEIMSLGAMNITIPGLFVFGDYYVDSGNNNNLTTISKANFTPYAVDFGGGKATGRFSNGRSTVDFIAQVAGLPFPPAYLDMSEGEKRRARVNFGSRSGWVLPEPAKVEAIFKHFFVFDEQLKLFQKAKEELRGEFNTAAGYQAHLEKSIFPRICLPAAYNKFLVPEFLKRVQRLYDLGARKIVINNVSPFGCQPF